MNAPSPIIDVAASREDAIYRGCTFCLLEIEDAARILNASIKTLRETFDARKMADVKLAADGTAKVARQIDALANTLGTTFGTHIARRRNHE